MGLATEIKSLRGNKRRFFLLRVSDMDTAPALKLCGIARGTYNSWFQNEDWTALYRRLPEFTDYKQEAIQLLRRDNQLEAVFLENKIINKLKEEIESGEYILARTRLAGDVYNKLISAIDAPPSATPLTYAERLALIQQNFYGGQVEGETPPEQIAEASFRELPDEEN